VTSSAPRSGMLQGPSAAAKHTPQHVQRSALHWKRFAVLRAAAKLTSVACLRHDSHPHTCLHSRSHPQRLRPWLLQHGPRSCSSPPDHPPCRSRLAPCEAVATDAPRVGGGTVSRWATRTLGTTAIKTSRRTRTTNGRAGSSTGAYGRRRAGCVGFVDGLRAHRRLQSQKRG
jgi:hypothetical protein